MDDIATARAAAAWHLSKGGYPAEAAEILAGQGDDYAEVRIALSLLAILKEMPVKPKPLPVSPLRRRLAGEEC